MSRVLKAKERKLQDYFYDKLLQITFLINVY